MNIDFNKFASRRAASKGAWMDIKDPWTGEPVVSEGKPCRVLLLGSASAEIQSAMRERQKAEMLKRKEERKRAKSSGEDEVEEARVMEDVHLEMVTNAAPFIADFENVSLDGKPLTKEDAVAFLDLTFPSMEQDGTETVDGKEVAKFKLANKPFAVQVAEFVAVGKNFLGNG